MAIKEKGYEIVKDYLIEIAILVAGAASGVQGGLQQFCFLAAWILFFDGILLFSFYAAILCIKLEINRIKRHVDMRKALEDDGVSRRVAENVARSNDWPRRDPRRPPPRRHLPLRPPDEEHQRAQVQGPDGLGASSSSTPSTCALSPSAPLTAPSPLSPRGPAAWAPSSPPPPVDPFKVASNGLDAILAAAKQLPPAAALDADPAAGPRRRRRDRPDPHQVRARVPLGPLRPLPPRRVCRIRRRRPRRRRVS